MNDRDFEFCKKELIESGVDFKIHQISKETKKIISSKIQSKIDNIREISSSLECSLGIVGGFVRDLLLGRKSEDVDFIVFKGDLQKLTTTVAEKMGGKIGKMSNRTLTTQVRFPDGIVFEFNSTRKERYEYPSRIPIVEKASIVEDLQRRDFTLNALIMFENSFIDLFNGVEDLQNQLIQTTRGPEIVFHEDYLRMFRAVRFACKLNFNISSEVENGIMLNAMNLLDVPKERIISELKTSLSYSPTKTFILMRDLGILEVMFPEVKNIELDNHIYSIKDTWTRIESKLKFLETKDSKNVNLFLTMILEEIIITRDSDLTQSVERILRHYKFSNKEISEILDYLKYRNSLIDLTEIVPEDFDIRKTLRELGDLVDGVILWTESELSIRTEGIDLDPLLAQILRLQQREDLIFFEPKLDGHMIREIFKIEGNQINHVKSLLIDAIMKEEIPNSTESCVAYLNEKDLKKELN